MARAKRASDERYNARRRAKRLLQRLEREDTSAMSRNERAARASYIQSIRDQIAETYQERKGTRQSIAASADKAQQASKRLDRQTQPVREQPTARKRANLLFERQINLARNQQPSTLGRYGAAEVSVFYAATRLAWRGRDPKKRNEYIMQALGVDSLQDAFSQVLAQNRQAVRRLSRELNASMRVSDTETDESFQAGSERDSERIGSPTWEPFVNIIRF